MEAYSELSALENKCLARVLARVLATPTTRNRGGGNDPRKKLWLYTLLYFCSFFALFYGFAHLLRRKHSPLGRFHGRFSNKSAKKTQKNYLAERFILNSLSETVNDGLEHIQNSIDGTQ